MQQDESGCTIRSMEGATGGSGGPMEFPGHDTMEEVGWGSHQPGGGRMLATGAGLPSVDRGERGRGR